VLEAVSENSHDMSSAARQLAHSGVCPEPALSAPASEQAGLSSERSDSELDVVVEADNDNCAREGKLQATLHITLTAVEYNGICFH